MSEGIENQILDSILVLEAFGNAKTVENNNSSRFGKYIIINFDEKGKIYSSKIFNFLFEKSRIVKVPENERNYNIFYQLLRGANENERKKFKLKDPNYFKYLTNISSNVENLEDENNFKITKDCLIQLKYPILIIDFQRMK